MTTQLIEMVRVDSRSELLEHGVGGFYWSGHKCHMICPGVGVPNYVSTKVHRWDGNKGRPTFAPSLNVFGGRGEVGWHGYVIDGRMGTSVPVLNAAACPGAVAFFQGR